MIRNSDIPFIPVLLTLLGAPRSTGAQQTVRIATEVSCQECSIRLTKLTTLGKLEDPLSLSTSSRVVAGNQRYFVAPLYNIGEVGVFASDGKYLQTFGRRGSGPGELQYVEVVTIQNDTVAVFSDNKTVRIENGSFRRMSETVLPATARDAVLLSAGRMVLHAEIGTAKSFGEPLHLVDSRGEVVRSFGNDARVVRYGDIAQTTRLLASAPSERIWSSRINEYRVELWDTLGAQLATYTREVAWFERWDRRPPGSPFTARPPTAIVGLQEHDSRLWVLMLVADSKWEPSPMPFERPRPGPTEWAKLFDMIVEVIDLRQVKVVTHMRLDQPLSGFAGPGLVFRLREGQDGLLSADVFSAQIAR